jgi:hypothetical protein
MKLRLPTLAASRRPAAPIERSQNAVGAGQNLRENVGRLPAFLQDRIAGAASFASV